MSAKSSKTDPAVRSDVTTPLADWSVTNARGTGLSSWVPSRHRTLKQRSTTEQSAQQSSQYSQVYLNEGVSKG